MMVSFKFNNDAFLKAVESGGGFTKVAKDIGVSYQTMLNWKNGRNSMSPENCEKLVKVTNYVVTKEQIMPNYPWADLEKQH